MKSCIYQILNVINNKFYIGHTIDYDIRWWEHERKLKANSHDNFHLQSAWNKYGKDVFEFIVIELVEPIKLLEREQYWMDLLGCCDIKLGYNINPNALKPPSGLGKKRTSEQKIKMSKSMTGLKRNDTSKMRKPKSEEHKRNLSFAKRNIEKWPCPDGYYCSCDICRPKRNRMKNYPNMGFN